MPQSIKNKETGEIIDLSVADDSILAIVKSNKFVCPYCSGKMLNVRKSKFNNWFSCCKHILDLDGYFCPAKTVRYKNTDAAKTERPPRKRSPRIPNITIFWNIFKYTLKAEKDIELNKENLTYYLNSSGRDICAAESLNFIPSEKFKKVMLSYLFKINLADVNENLLAQKNNFFELNKDYIEDICLEHPLFAPNSLVRLRCKNISNYFKHDLPHVPDQVFSDIMERFEKPKYKDENFFISKMINKEKFNQDVLDFEKLIHNIISNSSDYVRYNKEVINKMFIKEFEYDNTYRRIVELFLLFQKLEYSENDIRQLIHAFLTTLEPTDFKCIGRSFHECQILNRLNNSRRHSEFFSYYESDWSKSDV